jgi:NitT/TauT family transport system substrate-binding protein
MYWKKHQHQLLHLLQSHKADLISERPPYSKIVNNTFAEKAIKDVK